MQSSQQNNKESQFWQRGTKMQSSTVNSDSDHQSSNSSTGISDSGKKNVQIPKLKERNPFGALKHLTKEVADLTSTDLKSNNNKDEQSKLRSNKIEKLQSEIKGLLNQFNTMKYNVGEFLAQVISSFDSLHASNNTILEFVLGQAKFREMFRNFSIAQTTQLCEVLLTSIKNNNQQGNKESSIRFLGHITFERNEFDANTLKKVINQIANLAFNFKQNYSNNKTINKLAKPSINCLGNILTRDSPAIKEQSELLFKKLKDCFVQLMNNVQANYKSKRYISLLTTVVRSLQLSMNQLDQIKVKKTAPDSDAIILFLNFYKILFMGTDFANRVLQLRLVNDQKTSKSQELSLNNDQEESKVEGGVLDGSFVIDTSDVSSSNEAQRGGKFGSASGNDSVESMHDPYHKLKIYALQSLTILFKMCNKAFTLQSLWFLIFPSFLTRPRPELHQLVKDYQNKKESRDLFEKEAIDELKKEPTLFYLIHNKQENTKIKQQVVMSIVSLLQHSEIISKWQVVLKPSMDDTHSACDCGIGQFLLTLHYLLPSMLLNEKDLLPRISLLKIVSTVLQISPYQNFVAPLARDLLTRVICELRQCLDAWQISGRFSQQSESSPKLESNLRALTSQCLNTLAIGFGINEIRTQVSGLFHQDRLVLDLVKVVQGQSETTNDYNYEIVQVFQKVALNYDKQLMSAYLREDQAVKNFLEQVFNVTSDPKLIVQGFKFLEEWIKNIIPQNSLDEDEDQLVSANNLKQSQLAAVEVLDKEFTSMLNRVIHKFFNRKQSTELNIVIISLLSYFSSDLWVKVFESQQKIFSLADYLLALKQPPILKAAALRALGVIVMMPFFNENKDFLSKVFSFVIESSNDVNLSVQIRNSQACSSLCSILAQKYQSNEKNLTIEEETDSKLIVELLVVTLNYAYSIKEKVSSNALRGLGNYLGSCDLAKLEQKLIPQFKQCQIQLKSSSCEFNLIVTNLHESLRNKSPKVNWNACIVIGKILQNNSYQNSQIAQQLQSGGTINLLLDIIQKRSNLKAKIHATQTLLKFKSLIQDRNLIPRVWETLNEAFEQKSKFLGFTLERKYMETFETYFLQLWANVAQQTNEIGSLDQQTKEIFAGYLNDNGYLVLQNAIEYLTKELKVPQYSMMFDDISAFEQDTLQIFKDDSQLLKKLQNLQNVFICIQNQIEKNDLIRVSFANYDQFNQLAKTDIIQYRGLKCLRPQIKTSFNPTFEDRNQTASEQ